MIFMLQEASEWTDFDKRRYKKAVYHNAEECRILQNAGITNLGNKSRIVITQMYAILPTLRCLLAAKSNPRGPDCFGFNGKDCLIAVCHELIFRTMKVLGRMPILTGRQMRALRSL